MVNTAKLRGKMAERGYTVRSLSKVIGIHEQTMSVKLGDGKFSVGEAYKMADALCMSSDEIVDIFFADSVT